MKIAIPTRDERIDDHFGHCAYYTIVEINDKKQVISSEQLDSPEGCGCKSNIASTLQEMGVTVMIAGNMGQGAVNKLTSCGIQVIRGCQGEIQQVVEAFLNDNLTDNAQVCDHHDCDHHHAAGPVHASKPTDELFYN